MFKGTKRCIYVDPSPKKLRESSENAGRKPPKQLKQRFDLVFWMKTSDRVKAILEVKVSWEKNPVIGDIEKVSEYINKYESGATGYVLYYTDKKRKQKSRGKDAEVIKTDSAVLERNERLNLLVITFVIKRIQILGGLLFIVARSYVAKMYREGNHLTVPPLGRSAGGG